MKSFKPQLCLTLSREENCIDTFHLVEYTDRPNQIAGSVCWRIAKPALLQKRNPTDRGAATARRLFGLFGHVYIGHVQYFASSAQIPQVSPAKALGDIRWCQPTIRPPKGDQGTENLRDTRAYPMHVQCSVRRISSEAAHCVPCSEGAQSFEAKMLTLNDVSFRTLMASQYKPYLTKPCWFLESKCAIQRNKKQKRYSL